MDFMRLLVSINVYTSVACWGHMEEPDASALPIRRVYRTGTPDAVQNGSGAESHVCVAVGY